MTPMRRRVSAARSGNVSRTELLARRGILASLCTLPLLARGIAYAESDEIRFFRIGTAATTGTYFQIGGMLANAISKPPGSRDCALTGCVRSSSCRSHSSSGRSTASCGIRGCSACGSTRPRGT